MGQCKLLVFIIHGRKGGFTWRFRRLIDSEERVDVEEHFSGMHSNKNFPPDIEFNAWAHVCKDPDVWHRGERALEKSADVRM